MLGTIFTAIAIFIATGIDEMFVLTILFAQAQKKKAVGAVYIGQQIAMIALLGISILGVFGLTFITEKWIGLLGLVPIILGIRMLINGDEEDEEEEEILKKTGKFNSLIISVALIAIGGGGEELAIYIPYFSALDTTELIITLITFNLLVPIWCILCQKVASFKYVKETVEKYERILVPIVFVGLGLFVLIENDTFSVIMGKFV